jgi:hypothetical protein
MNLVTQRGCWPCGHMRASDRGLQLYTGVNCSGGVYLLNLCAVVHFASPFLPLPTFFSALNVSSSFIRATYHP